ncbi:hypothetical protein HD806DRAFT_543246 [Xylariaceae sp. AK1471]|nr:hypothetical protein HD806DRAFT_543246 [Xylariaceae sp. AK1471]
MAESKARDEGDYFPFTRGSSPKVAPPPEPETKPSTSNTTRSLTPRGQRFKHLSEAYRNITLRQGSNNSLHEALEQAESQPAVSNQHAPVSLPDTPVAGPRVIVKSQDDLEIPSPASAARGTLKRSRAASFNSIDFFGDLSPKMGRNRISLSEQIKCEMTRLKAQAQALDISGSTIERILDQYDTGTSSVEIEHDTREHRANTEFSISQPPQITLPGAPPTNMRPASSVRQSECDSPVPDSSISNSQHLLDADAQARELEEARRALVPLPLNLIQSRNGIDIPREQSYDASTGFVVFDSETPAKNPFAHPEDQVYKTYLEPPMEREISQKLRHVSGHAGQSVGTLYSADGSIRGIEVEDAVQLGSDAEDSLLRLTRPRGKIFSQASLPTTSTGGKPIRHINVNLGPEPETGKDNKDSYDAQVDAKHHHTSFNLAKGDRDTLSEDGDWVTEATSDAGFDFGVDAVAEGSPTVGYKQTGSSLANYSDDENEDQLGRFGSRERIIQHPASEDQYKPFNVQRPKDSKFAVLLPHRHNGFPENANRRWASAEQQEPSQFRPQPLTKTSNPFRAPNSRRPEASTRLAFNFNFDKNARSKYEFRDSMSEYEPAVASTKANCGTHPYATHGSLPSPVSEAGDDNHPSTTDAHFDRSADFDADRNPSNRVSQRDDVYQTPRRGQDGPVKLSIYAADRRRQLEDLERQQFAAASSYYDPPSASSVRSKFNFELLPLDIAKRKNKQQRDSGETNETESTMARLKRKQSATSSDPLEPPAKAFFTSRDLSINFSPPNWQLHDLNLEDTPTPFGMGVRMGRYSEATPSKNRKHRKDSGLGMPNTPSSFGTPSVTRRLWYNERERNSAPPQNRHRHKPRPGFVAPDDYVSDRADRIRLACFYILAMFSLLPFVGVLVLSGAFSEALKWATRGEVDRLTARQRRSIKWMLLVEAIIYTGAVITVVVYFVVKSKVRS